MPFIIAIIGLFAPRLVAFLLWLFTDWLTGVFDTMLWPLLGFFFLPLTMLWYSAVANWYGGEWNEWRVAVLVLAVLFDMSSDHGATRKKR